MCTQKLDIKFLYTNKIINKRDEAILCYQKAILLKHNNIEALISLSTILKEDKNYNHLIEIYKKILKLDEKNIKHYII